MASTTSFWGALPVPGRWLLSTVAIQTLGRGLTLPFAVIYMHEVRGFDLDLAGVLMSLLAVTAVLTTGPSGAIADRIGARPVLLTAYGCQALGCVVLAFATHPAAAGLAMALIGVNFGAAWPALNTLLASLVSGELRQRYFGVNFVLINVGIGFGGVVSGFALDVSDSASFTTCYLIAAACALVPMLPLLGPLRRYGGRPNQPDEPDSVPATYRSILQQRSVQLLTGLTFAAVFLGYGQLESGVPAFARVFAEVPTQTVGLGFGANSAAIVALQVLVVNRMSGRRRTRALVLAGMVWIISWLVLGSTQLVPGTAAATAGVIAFMTVFALGEMLMLPAVPGICNDIASDRTRGRHNAINYAAFQLGAFAGPIASGFLLEHGATRSYVVLMLAGCLTVSSLALALERHISPAVNGVGPATAPEGATA